MAAPPAVSGLVSPLDMPSVDGRSFTRKPGQAPHPLHSRPLVLLETHCSLRHSQATWESAKVPQGVHPQGPTTWTPTLSGRHALAWMGRPLPARVQGRLRFGLGLLESGK